MITTQYKITLPTDYNMDIIKKRIKLNGHKTDGFLDLKFKLYLITENEMNSNIQNSYSPLYFWKSNEGLNKFLFEGYYDNILSSFGWQTVNIGVPLIDTTTNKIISNQYLFEFSNNIRPQKSLKNIQDQIRTEIPTIKHTEYIVIYNPEEWRYSAFYFIDDLKKTENISGTTYTILHISTEDNN